MKRRNKINAGVGYAHYDGIDGSSITVLEKKRSIPYHPFKVTILEQDNVDISIKVRIDEGFVWGLNNKKYSADYAWSVESVGSRPLHGEGIKFVPDPVSRPPGQTTRQEESKTGDELNDANKGHYLFNPDKSKILYVEMTKAARGGGQFGNQSPTKDKIELKYGSKEAALSVFLDQKIKFQKNASSGGEITQTDTGNPLNEFGGEFEIFIENDDPETPEVVEGVTVTITQGYATRFIGGQWAGIVQVPICEFVQDGETKEWSVKQLNKSDIFFPYSHLDFLISYEDTAITDIQVSEGGGGGHCDPHPHGGCSCF